MPSFPKDRPRRSLRLAQKENVHHTERKKSNQEKNKTRNKKKNITAKQTKESPKEICIKNTSGNGEVLSEFCTTEEIPRITYEERKRQPSGEDDAYILDNGIEYDGTSPLISDLFDETRLNEKVHTATGIENVRRSYIYVISKVVDNRTFIKIGISRLSNSASTSTRLGFIQTTLIPGLQNIGFKLHYLFFYSRESKEKGSTFAENIEKDLHKTLQNHREFKTTVIQFPSSNPSEWYLPEPGTYKKFIRYVLNFIRVQVPFPEEGYHFFERYGKFRRASLDTFMDKPTPDDGDILQFRKDYIELKNMIRAKYKLTKNENNLKKGTKLYFKKKLIQNPLVSTTPPLGETIQINDIYYHNKVTDLFRTHKEYYAIVENKMDKTKKPTSIHIDFTETRQDNTMIFYSHISHVLQQMKNINTLETYELTSNYNFYFDEPIQRAKHIIKTFEPNSNIKFKVNELKWTLGRYLRDKNNNTFLVDKLHIDPRKKVKVDSVGCIQVDDELKIIVPETTVKANTIVVLQLIIDYQESNVPSFEINENYIPSNLETRSTKYKIYDFISFKPNFFINDDTDKGINERFDAIVVNIYYDYDKDTDKYLQFYDVLFENELWKLDTKKVDENSDKIQSIVKKRIFVAGVKYKRNLITKVIKELGLTEELKAQQPKRITRKRVVQTTIINNKPPSSHPYQTRSRKQKNDYNTRTKLHNSPRRSIRIHNKTTKLK